MKKTSIISFSLLLTSILAGAQTRIFHTSSSNVDLIQDKDTLKGGWTVSPEIKPDVLETTANVITFASDKDTLTIENLKEWETFDFVMLTEKGDSAYARVKRIAKNPFENPDPDFLKIAPSGKLSREQAAFDIDALIYGLSQVHPDIFAVCSQADLFRAVNKAKKSLPDSVSKLDLYKAAAPIVAMIGDGHTNLLFPTKSVFTSDLKRMPLYVDVLTDRSIICKSSLDSIIKRGDKILSINGVSSDSLINAMMPYVSGERTHFKISRINSNFTGLFQMLFPAEEYIVEYQPAETKKKRSHTFPALAFDEIKKRCPTTRSKKKYINYSYSVDSLNNVAIMDFRSFSNVDKMTEFADSMFSDLRKRNIKNLIIDIRNNGGGNSAVGDVVLRY
ncbi:MAG: hypothetical protein K2G90_03930, partial [Muribaculaceae bacterium]|nr:hypothetical protein [Muribaculaceae bacterium]